MWLIVLSGILALSGAVTAQVQCYRAVGCQSDDLINTTATISDCCLGQRDDGLYYVKDGACTECVVYGVDIPGESLEFPTFTAPESSITVYSLPVGTIKGRVETFVEIRAEVLPGGTATEGSDFYLFTESIVLGPGAGAGRSLELVLQVDGIAMERDETFVLRLSATNPLPAAENVFFVDLLYGTIEDQEGIDIQFTETDYVTDEGDQAVVVAVQVKGRWATDVAVFVTPLDYDELRSSRAPLPPDFPEVPASEPWSPNRANEMDYLNLPSTILFQANDGPGTVTLPVYIPVYDDEINESDEEVFAVILELADAVDPSRVDLSVLNATLCIIADNDDIEIGFELPSYTYMEADVVIGENETGAVYLVKSRESSQTFTVSVRTTGIEGAGESDAKHQDDYSIGPSDEVFFQFAPDQFRVLVPIELFNDNIPEGTEAFKLISSVQLLTSTNAISTVFIEDDGDSIIIELRRLGAQNVIVSEDVGIIEYCCEVIEPTADEELPVYIDVLLSTVAGSADKDDFEMISLFALFDEYTRLVCFNITIYDDPFFELEEEFSLSANVSDLVPVTIKPNISVITIVDNDILVAGITQHVEVVEGATAELCINMTDPPPTASLPRSFTIDVFTEDGTAGPFDYQPQNLSSQLNQTHRLTCFAVDTIDNILSEATESFIVRAVLQDPIDAFKFTPSISTIVIMDDDSIDFNFASPSYVVSEGDGSVTVVVEMSGHTTVPVNIQIMTIFATSTDPYTATDQDFIRVNRSLIFTNITALQEIQIAIIDDEIIDKHFSVQIITNGEVIDATTVTIKEDDELMLGFSSPQFSVMEREAQQLIFKIVKENMTNVPVTIQITRVFLDDAPNSAYPDCLALGATLGDYEAEPTTTSVTLGKDEYFVNGTVQIVNDNIEEETEQFQLKLTVTEGAIVTHDGSMQEIADVYILDDDRVSAEFVNDSYKVNESSDGGVLVCIQRDNGTDRDYIVYISTLVINAQDEDFIPLNQESITLASSREGIQVCSPVNVVDDDIALEGEESLQVNLSLPRGSQLLLGETTVANITISDDDVVRVEFTNQNFVVTNESAVDVSVMIDTRIAQPLDVTVLVNASSTNCTEGTTNFSDAKMLTFDPLSNSTVHATFDLREVHNVESLNITLELPDSMAVVMGDNAWATFSVAAPSNTVIHPSSTMNPFPSVTVESRKDSGSENVVPYAVAGSILAILILLVSMAVAVVVYLRWKAYSYRAQPRFQGTASILKDTRLYVTEGDPNRHPGTLVRGTSRYLKNLMDSKQHIPGSCIHLLNCIGKGQFGIVYSARLNGWQDGSQDGIIAVKTLKDIHSQGDIDAFLKESLKMKEFNHSNVLNLIGVSLDAGESPYIVMPYMANGSLLNYLKKKRPNLTIDSKAPEELIQDARRQLLSMCLQVAKGMEYLAEQNVVHRDLAARNCMIDAKGVIKVADFGLSESLYTKTYFREGGEDVKLPVKWMAIESLRDCVFTEKSDVWSFGVTCWEVFTLGTMPYPGVDPFNVMRYLQEGQRLDRPLNAACDDQVYKILLSCWKEDPDERPNFSDLVSTISIFLERLAGYMSFSEFSLTCEELPILQEQSPERSVDGVQELLTENDQESVC